MNETAATAKTIQLVKNIQTGLPLLNVDVDKTTTLAANLQGNAIVFRISNAGQGIALFYLDKIFDRYFLIPGSKKETHF